MSVDAEDIVTLNADAIIEIESWREWAMDPTPVSLNVIVQRSPTYEAYSDASGKGVGGLLFNLQGKRMVHAWKETIPEDLRRELVRGENPMGKLSISDFEMAGVVINLEVTLRHLGHKAMRHEVVALFTDSMTSLSWILRRSSKKNEVNSLLKKIYSVRQLKL